MKEKTNNETVYQITMYLVRKILDEELITADDYKLIEEYFSQKYSAVLGRLFFEPLVVNK